MRYSNNFKLTVHFYGADITENERNTAEKLVKANAINYLAASQIYFHKSPDELMGKLT
jgi:hypothetical protein